MFEAANQGEDSCEVKCPNPNCSREHLQCTHCNKRILMHDNAVLKRESRRPQSATRKHLKQCSSCSKNAKRHKTDADMLLPATMDFDTGQDNSADY